MMETLPASCGESAQACPDALDFNHELSGSPLFWLHHAIKDGLRSAAFHRAMQRTLRKLETVKKPTAVQMVHDDVDLYSAAATKFMLAADESWRNFCGARS